MTKTQVDIATFKKLLHEGEVAFSFKKLNGEVREARGTLCESLMPKKAPSPESTDSAASADPVTSTDPVKELPKKARTPRKEGTIIYYDLDKAAFRSFNQNQLLKYITP